MMVVLINSAHPWICIINVHFVCTTRETAILAPVMVPVRAGNLIPQPNVYFY
jgi:hypothetical protein